VIEAQTEGYIKGTSIISGIPVYDEAKEKLSIRNQVQAENNQYSSKTASSFSRENCKND
jgi:hypothetical protein